MHSEQNFRRLSTTLCLSLCALFLVVTLPQSSCWADEEYEDGWLMRRDQSGSSVATFELLIHPSGEPRPALKYRLIPDHYDQVDGNAAVHYLKAMGFFEETNARRAVDQFERGQAKRAEELGQDDSPPYSWMKMPPSELPIAATKDFLKNLDFQPRLIREASKRRSFKLDRNLRQEDNPLMVPLPEIQQMRGLARYQSLRTRLAIAENRIPDAIETVGQQYVLAHHLGNDELFVPTLVGSAVARIAFKDTVHLLNHRETPNLYWALASLPTPLIDATEASSYERQFLFEQVKCLREVTDKVRPEGYWDDVLDRFLKQIAPLYEFEAAHDRDQIKEAYPAARKYLTEECGMTMKQFETYPRIQAVLLAAKRYYEFARDEQFKWEYVSYSNLRQNPGYRSIPRRITDDRKRYGWIAEPAYLVLPTMLMIRTSRERIQQKIALLQTIESIRMYAHENDQQLPTSLKDLRLPAPNDPISGEPFFYEVDEGAATLRATKVSMVVHQFKLSIADLP